MYFRLHITVLMLQAAFGLQVKTDDCPGTIHPTGMNSGRITSPNYPSNYGDDRNCHWLLATSYSQNIHLSFEEFSTESCCDHVRVWNGNLSFAGDDSSIVGKFSGNNPANTVVNGTSNMVVINFKSDGSVTYRGFSLKYGVKLRDISPALNLTPSVQNVRTKSVRFDWRYPTNSSVKHVTIKYWKHWNPTGTNTFSVAYPATDYTIWGLSVCTHYHVTIKAVGPLVNGPWSNITFQTASEVPKVAPTNLAAQAKTSQSIAVTWKAPVGISCSPDGYEVSFSTSQEQYHERYVFDQGLQYISYTLTNLRKWTDYYISVRVHNEKGYGPPSTVIKRRTKEDWPDAAPDNFQVAAINDSSVRLSWKLPPTGKRNGIIRGFKILYNHKYNVCSPGASPQINIPGNRTFHFILENLAADIEYTFKILAYTIKDGPYSMEIIRKPPNTTVITTTAVKQGHQQDCKVEKTLGYVSASFNVALIGIIIALMFYIRHFMNQNDWQRNLNDKQDKVTNKNDYRDSHEAIQMKDIHTSHTNQGLGTDQFQPRDLGTSNLEATEENYQALHVDSKQERPVYEKLNRRKKPLDNDSRIGRTVNKQPPRAKEEVIEPDKPIYANLYVQGWIQPKI